MKTLGCKIKNTNEGLMVKKTIVLEGGNRHTYTRGIG